MGVYVTPQSEIDKYFESECLGQSTLKPLKDGLDKFLNNQKEEKELYYEEKGSLIIGSAVDCILTGEEGKFDDIYYTSDIEKKPSDAEMSIINMVFDEMLEEYPEGPYLTLDKYPGLVERSVDFHGWQKNWKQETRIQKMTDAGLEYFEDLKLAIGKQVIDKTQLFTINNIVSSLRENPLTKSYFDREVYQNNPMIDVYYQLPIYFEYRGIACKALLDILFVFKDGDGNILSLMPVDLKTTFTSTLQFTSFKTYRYDIQAAWYTQALKSPSSTINNIVGDNTKLKIYNFRFVVESTVSQGSPLVYEVTDEVLHIGKYGRPAINTFDLNKLFSTEELYQPIPIVKEVKGFDTLITDYLYYQETEWREDKLLANSNGVLQLGWEGIIGQNAD